MRSDQTRLRNNCLELRGNTKMDSKCSLVAAATDDAGGADGSALGLDCDGNFIPLAAIVREKQTHTMY